MENQIESYRKKLDQKSDKLYKKGLAIGTIFPLIGAFYTTISCIYKNLFSSDDNP